jgi:hypothetical protein
MPNPGESEDTVTPEGRREGIFTAGELSEL